MKDFIREPLFWLLLGFGLICIAFAPVLANAADATDLEKLRTQVLANTVQLNENCSGTLIWSDKDDKSGEVETVILTAKHCVLKGGDQAVDFPVYQDNRVVKKDRYIGKVKGKWFAGDLGLIVLKDKQTLFDKVATIAPEKPGLVMGEDVWTVGYPLAMSLTITKGMFSSFETVDYPEDGTEYFRSTPDATFGNSGGALYHKNAAGDYELIGVTSARMNDNTFMALYVPISQIREYLKIAVPGAVAAPVVKASN